MELLQSEIISPRNFLQKVEENTEFFNIKEQHDSHEFLNYILNEMNDFLDENKHENFIDNLLKGEINNNIKCLNCNKVFSMKENFFEIQINVKKNSSLSKNLKKFFEIEKLDKNSYDCENCNKKTDAHRFVEIKILPKYFILHINRYYYCSKEKNLIKGKYIIPFIFEYNLEVNKIKIKINLFAIIVHIGVNMNSGHYIILIKEDENLWVKYDDSVVKLTEEELLLNYFGGDIGNESAYILIFKNNN